MAATAGTFSAANQASQQILLRQGESLSASVSGAFTARVLLQKSLGTTGWETIQTLSSSPSAFDVTNNPGVFRLFCVFYGSGTVAYQIQTTTQATTSATPPAASVTYDPTATALAVNSVQDAIDTIQIGRMQIYNIKSYGAIGDGVTHPLSSRYSTLADAKIVYPTAAALTEEIDFNAVRR